MPAGLQETLQISHGRLQIRDVFEHMRENDDIELADVGRHLRMEPTIASIL